MTELPELPFLLTYGAVVYWIAFAFAALLGPLTTWLLARSGARRRAAAARDGLGSPSARLQASADGEVAVLSGVLELDGAECAIESWPGDAIASAETRFLRVGETRVALEGDVELRAGSRERWGASPAGAPPDAAHPGMWRMAAHRYRLASGAKARARGMLQILPTAGEQSYREAGLRHILVPDGSGRIGLAAEGRPAVRLTRGLTACGLLLFATMFAGVSCAGATLAFRNWGAGKVAEGDLDGAQRLMRWAGLVAGVPYRGQPPLDAVESALSLYDVDDPEAHRDLVLLSASFERHRTGTCFRALNSLEHTAARRFVAEVGQACGDVASLRSAAGALMLLGEFEAAADLAARIAAMDPARTPDQIELERSSALLAGRLGAAAAVIREMLPRIDDFYATSSEGAIRELWRAELRGKLSCAADQLSARAGDAAAGSRLDAAAWSGAPPVRRTCALLLADLAVGAQRLAVIDRIRRDPALADIDELELLEVEVDPTRAAADRVHTFVTAGARILAGRDASTDPDPLQWSALDRLSTVAEPPLPARMWRVNVAAELAAEASLVGDDARALRWSELVQRDVAVLRAGGKAYATAAAANEQLDELVLQHAYLEVRAGRLPARPSPRAVDEPSDRREQEWRELTGVLDFLERGELGALDRPVEYGIYARSPGRDRVFDGLEIAARGSGARLARWLEHQYQSMAVALVAARRIRAGRSEMLAWLRRLYTSSYGRSLGELAIDAANRQKVSEGLGARDVAAEHRAVAERLRRAHLRRDTALVRDVLAD